LNVGVLRGARQPWADGWSGGALTSRAALPEVQGPTARAQEAAGPTVRAPDLAGPTARAPAQDQAPEAEAAGTDPPPPTQPRSRERRRW